MVEYPTCKIDDEQETSRQSLIQMLSPGVEVVPFAGNVRFCGAVDSSQDQY